MLIQQLINGLTIGTSYALVTIGFTMIYGVLELTNFAHSSYYMFGAYLCITIMGRIGETAVGFWTGLVVSIIICAVLAALMDRITLRKIRQNNGLAISALLCTIGIQTLINNGIILIYGSQTRKFPNLFDLGRFKVGPATVSYIQVIIAATAIVIMIILTILITKTRFGLGMRSISQNSNAAKMMGVKVDKIITWTFFISTSVSAISGVLIGLYYRSVEPSMANVVGSKAFAAAILGGIGELPGAVIGGFIIGVLEALVAGYISSGYRDAIAFAVLIIILIIRPQGILGKKISHKV